jgi:hypothetical protein
MEILQLVMVLIIVGLACHMLLFLLLQWYQREVILSNGLWDYELFRFFGPSWPGNVIAVHSFLIIYSCCFKQWALSYEDACMCLGTEKEWRDWRKEI